MPMRLSHVLTFILTAAAAFSSAAVIETKDLRVATEGDSTYFRVQVPLPADAAPMPTYERFSGSARVPLLLSNPPHAVPTYMMINRVSMRSAAEGTDNYIGRTQGTGPVKLHFHYPKKEGGWAENELTLDLSKAEKLTTQTVSLEEGTTTTELSPAQQFASAQAEFFRNAKFLVGNDAGFFNFARLQTLKQAGLPTPIENEWNIGNPDDLRNHLYDTATGARAIQESLQVDRMLRASTTSESRTIDIASVEGVQTKSHPFKEMMAGKEPKFSDLAKVVPADQYMLRFTSPAKLQELADFAQQWGASVLESPEVGSADAGLRSRYQKQLCLPSTVLTKVLGPALVKELAITGSDPFFREGTDVTVIFDAVSPDLLKTALDQHWKAAAAENPGADTKPEGQNGSTSGVSGQPVEKIVTADRTVSAYRTVSGNLVIYSNSRSALHRILGTHKKPDTSLASADDFRYMRTVWPQTPEAEDGFLYLSDAFIRRLTGPATKIKEKRRIEAYGSMRMVLNAAMLHGYVYGPGKVPTLEELTTAGLLDKAALASEGDISWQPQSIAISNSIYGRPQYMTPLADLSIDKITKTEQDEYVRFRDRYQQYWRRYFDPIGVRIKVDRTISMEAYILPLIEETHYQDLKRLTGDKPQKFDLSQITTATLGRWQVSLDMEAREVKDARQMVGSMFGKDSTLTDWIGKWGSIWVEDSGHANHMFDWFFEAAERDMDEGDVTYSPSMTSFFQVPAALGIDVKNGFSLAAFLVAMQGMVKSAAPDLVRFTPQDPYKGVTFVKISPAPNGPISRELEREAERAREAIAAAGQRDTQTTQPEVGVYYGTIKNGFYVSTQKSVLEHLVDRSQAPASSAPPREVEYNFLLTASPSNAQRARPLIEKGTAQISRVAERDRLRQAWLLYRCGAVGANDDVTSAAQKWFGGELILPSGGQISYNPARDEAVSSVWGPMRQMKSAKEAGARNPMLQLVDSIAHLRAWLRFTDDGLLSHVEVERKQ